MVIMIIDNFDNDSDDDYDDIGGDDYDYEDCVDMFMMIDD